MKARSVARRDWPGAIGPEREPERPMRVRKEGTEGIQR